jgi:uncharacterized protein
MDHTGIYAFAVSSNRVFHALLDPTVLKTSIPGCEAVWYGDNDDIVIRLSLPVPIPSLQGPYDVTVRVKERHEPDILVIQAQRFGSIAGSVDSLTRITLTDTDTGSLLSYEAHADLQGPITIASSPPFQAIIKLSLAKFFKNVTDVLQGSDEVVLYGE